MPLTSMMPLTAEAPTTHLLCPPLVPFTPGPERATLASRNYRLLRKTPRGAYSSGSPSLLHLGPTSSFDHKKLSTSRAVMVEASASLQYGARNPQTTRVHQSSTQYHTTARTSTIQAPISGYAHNRETGSTSFTHPVYSSSGGGQYAVASTGYAGTEEASGILGNDARIPDVTGAEPWSKQYYAACGPTTVSGHTHVSERGMTSSLHMVSSSSVNHAQPSASRAGIEEASAVPENFARIPDATGAEPWSTHYYAASGTTTVYDVSCSRSTTCLHLESTSSIDHTLPSTSCAGMEASASLQYDASANEAITPQKSWSSQRTPHSSMFADHFQGHANSTGSGSAGFTVLVYSSSRGCDDSVASTSHAGMPEASGMSENETRYATRSGGSGHQELSGVSGNVSRRWDALRGHHNQHTGDTAPICKARDQPSVKLSEFVECCRIRDAKKHECEICGKLFLRARYLEIHKRTHTNERPYKCETCDKLFRLSHHLDYHRRTHTGEKPHTCETCGKSFAQKGALYRHQLTHTDERPHVCHKCSKSFKAKLSLQRHLKSCCRVGAFVCEICDESFIDNSHLRHHYARVHGHIIPPE
ncbi:uncharacterized protein [Dermacentor albipictus]|uniref:uncharacterized protein isoform X2 n=2 Tax=Dermacentor albipictus TaxID=60249 RepID=UPI0038FC6B25